MRPVPSVEAVVGHDDENGNGDGAGRCGHGGEARGDRGGLVAGRDTHDDVPDRRGCGRVTRARTSRTKSSST